MTAPVPEPTPTPAPAPTPTPAPVTPAPEPAPAPVVDDSGAGAGTSDTPFPTPDLTKASWWQWALTTLVSLAVAVGTLLGHPFDSTLVAAIVPSVALVAASVATAFQVHGVHAQKVALIRYQEAVHTAQVYNAGARNAA